jgi:hypothetical protein
MRRIVNDMGEIPDHRASADDCELPAAQAPGKRLDKIAKFGDAQNLE